MPAERHSLSDRSKRKGLIAANGLYAPLVELEAAEADAARLRVALEGLVSDVEREVSECAKGLDGEDEENLCSTCRELLKPWAERAREALNGGQDV